MNLKDIIRAPKRVSDYGKWGTGDIDRALWPLKRKKLKQSPDWDWRVIQMECGQRDFRVLLKLNAQIEQFYAMLGEVRVDTVAVLCSHDLHTSHGNWHCHATTGDVSEVFAGAWRDKDSHRKWPCYNGPCQVGFDVTRERAVLIASELYRFEPPDQMEMVV